MAFALTAAGAALAVALELAEACAIVLAVGVSRRWRDALIGAAAGAACCAVLAILLGPVLLGDLAIDGLRVVIGTLLILFGLEWLRKGTLRLGGRRARSSAAAEYDEVAGELEDLALPPPGQADWAARAIAFKGVLLEGVEIVLIVSVLAARPDGAAAAIVGAAAAVAFTIAAAFVLRRPLAVIPETELKWLVGVLLTSFGVFFCAEGLGAEWPGGDAALLYCAAALAGFASLQIIRLRRGPDA
jgi:Ca2+/H+ antiporter, TMEM165/GDT1 family